MREEEKKRIDLVQSVTALFKKDFYQCFFRVIVSYESLIATLNTYTVEEEKSTYRPIFILTGHGTEGYGFMKFMDGFWLRPQNLIDRWNPIIACDFVATQCSCNYFLNIFTNPCLLKRQNVRWIAASEINTTSTSVIKLRNKQSYHIELTKILLAYTDLYTHCTINGSHQTTSDYYSSMLEILGHIRNEKKVVAVEPVPVTTRSYKYNIFRCCLLIYLFFTSPVLFLVAIFLFYKSIL